MSGFERLRDLDPKTGMERRPKTVKNCPVKGCDWFMVTSYYVGGPNRTQAVSNEDQQRAAGEHMKVHIPPPKKIFV